jgi:nicotinamidase-related amidase
VTAFSALNSKPRCVIIILLVFLPLLAGKMNFPYCYIQMFSLEVFQCGSSPDLYLNSLIPQVFTGRKQTLHLPGVAVRRKSMTTTLYSAINTALLIVDPYNDFMSEGGKFYEATRETAEAVGFYDNMRKLIPAIRAAHIQIIVVPHHRWRKSDYAGWKHINPSQIGVNQNHGFAAGTWGGEFHPEFGPSNGDIVVLEHWGQSGFANTDLDAQLKQRGIEKIILVGFVANTCIESTARFGMELGYHVTLIKDATAAFEQAGMVAAHEVNGPRFAHAILITDELLALLPQPARPDRSIPSWPRSLSEN